MSEIRDEKLDFWIKHGLNVLFIGKHGVGKTARVVGAFDRNKLNWRYFSASTMDPWVDFIGVPKSVTNANGTQYLELVRPREFQDDEVEALFFDEFNRSHKKIRNAVMELIQFRSINGKKFKKLKLIWAAINPEEEGEYDVEKLDPAQSDRFHVYVNIPYKPCMEYFVDKYGSENAKSAMTWWEELPKEQQDLISPRRLDYAMEIHDLGGDLRDVLPHGSNVRKLLSYLSEGPVVKRLQDLFDSKDTDKAAQFLAVENNYASAVTHLTEKDEYLDFFLPLLPPEKVSVILSSNNKKAFDHVIDNMDKVSVFGRVVGDILKASINWKLIYRIKKRAGVRGKTLPGNAKGGADAYYWAQNPVTPWLPEIKSISAMPADTTQERKLAYDRIQAGIPQAMTGNEPLETLHVLNQLAARSYDQTLLRDWPNFIKIVNHCLNELYRTSGKTWDQIQKEQGHHFRRLLTKITYNSELASQVVYPGVTKTAGKQAAAAEAVADEAEEADDKNAKLMQQALTRLKK